MEMGRVVRFNESNGGDMLERQAIGFGLALCIFSSGASAGIPSSSYSHDFDIGTLTSAPYPASFVAVTNLLLHSYTFDLAAPATVDVWLYNPRVQTGDIFTGFPPLTMTFYDVNIFDSQDHLLYAGTTTDKWGFGSTRIVHAAGVLPAGENYYVRIAGQQLNDSTLSYQLQMAALPVPEPQSYAMFLAGLGFIGWRLRKTKN